MGPQWKGRQELLPQALQTVLRSVESNCTGDAVKNLKEQTDMDMVRSVPMQT